MKKLELNKEECLQVIDRIEKNVNTTELERLKELLNNYFSLYDKYIKLEAENIGLKQTVRNFREKQEKFFGNRYY